MHFRSIVALCLPVLLATPASAAKLVLSGADFHGATNDHHYFLIPTASIEGQGGSGAGCLIASVDLPNGAILQNMRVRYLDGSPIDDFALDLKRKRRGNSVPASTVTGLETTGWQAGILERDGSPVTLPAIDDHYIYYLSTDRNCLDSPAQRIYAVTFEYLQPPIFADGFESGNTNAWGSPPSLVRSEWLTGADFRSDYTGSEAGWLFNPELGTFMHLGPPGVYCGVAPVELPHGATVNSLIAHVYDVNADQDVVIALRRGRMATAAEPTVMAGVSSSGDGGWQLVYDPSVTSAVVDNGSFWYYLTACEFPFTLTPGPALLTQAVEILYMLP